MSLGVLKGLFERRADASRCNPVTLVGPKRVTPKPAPTLACTLVTRVTPPNGEAGLQAGNPLMSREDADRAHWPAWTGDELDRTVQRVHLFMCRGMGADHAEHLSERLLLRDRERDDRRMCLECLNLTGTHCAAARQGRVIGASRDLQPVRDMLQRCEAFEGPA